MYAGMNGQEHGGHSQLCGGGWGVGMVEGMGVRGGGGEGLHLEFLMLLSHFPSICHVISTTILC